METAAIKQAIEELLRALGVAVDTIEVSTHELSGSPKFVIRSQESRLLIGPRGETLSALNHLLRKVLAKRLPNGEDTRFFLDVDGYQEKIIDELQSKVRMLSERARSLKTNVELEPMSAYERMLVHASLQNDPELTTESFGQGSGRRIVIKYKGV
ncbi:MAG: protein Jag [Parcubacteria group bacterium Gr01-1014_72]|nr:MAG: protein Jag [Parcubacteria group bacterium Gr01-1014_72]